MPFRLQPGCQPPQNAAVRMHQSRSRFVNPGFDHHIVEPMPVRILRFLIETSLPCLNQAGSIGVAVRSISVKEDGITNPQAQWMPLKVRSLASELVELREKGGMVIVITEHVVESAMREFFDKTTHPLRGDVNGLARRSQSAPAKIEDVSAQHKVAGLRGSVSNRLKEIVAERPTGQQMQVRHKMAMKAG